ncbi:hypothetical protein WISP_116794 [Willisornis vidua]|uniref:Uncharacterized protein n=1 Tax=Willisornis vidua TaxID=1566151 RepID=A0ABQ9CTP1_9PASS|nr:hypothetical protein WISP_116794 [Willisornis vidua]
MFILLETCSRVEKGMTAQASKSWPQKVQFPDSGILIYPIMKGQVNADRIIEYTELEGTHKDHQSPSPGPAQDNEPSSSNQTLNFTQLERQMGELVLYGPIDLQELKPPGF